MPGPKPTPTTLLKLRGSWRTSKRKREPVAPDDAPTPPKWLSKDARAGWNWVVEALRKMRLLSSVDMPTIALFAEAWGEWVEANRKAAKARTTVGSTGNRVVSPWVRIKNEAAARLLAVAQQFGLSPAARSKVMREGNGEEGKDKKSRFFGSA